jgi:hypothetical protein
LEVELALDFPASFPDAAVAGLDFSGVFLEEELADTVFLGFFLEEAGMLSPAAALAERGVWLQRGL